VVACPYNSRILSLSPIGSTSLEHFAFKKWGSSAVCGPRTWKSVGSTDPLDPVAPRPLHVSWWKRGITHSFPLRRDDLCVKSCLRCPTIHYRKSFWKICLCTVWLINTIVYEDMTGHQIQKHIFRPRMVGHLSPVYFISLSETVLPKPMLKWNNVN